MSWQRIYENKYIKIIKLSFLIKIWIYCEDYYSALLFKMDLDPGNGGDQI